jgi:protein disulfide-isomerase
MRLINGILCVLVLVVGNIPLFAGSAGSQQQIKWFDDYSKASAEAKASNKPIVLFFTGSDWCGWCKKMVKEIFQTPGFAQEAGNDFIFVDVDFPMNKKLPENIVAQNASLKSKYGITGYPTLIILDPQGNFIAETGYRMPEGGTYPDGTRGAQDNGRAYALYLKGLLK